MQPFAITLRDGGPPFVFQPLHVRPAIAFRFGDETSCGQFIQRCFGRREGLFQSVASLFFVAHPLRQIR
jgi:hypothetical protein